MEYVNIHISFTLNLVVTKKPWVMEKTAYIFEFSVKSSIGIRYFPSCAKKKLNFVVQCYYLLIQCYVHLHVSSLKCSSSGGCSVYMQRMVLSLCKQVSGRVLLKHDLLVVTI